MSPLIGLAAALAVAVGFAALVGILIGGAPRRAVAAVAAAVDAVDAGVRSDSVASSRAPRKPPSEIVPKGYVGMLERQIILAGRPAGWTVDKIIIAKPLLTVAVAAIGLFWVVLDPIPFRLAVAGLFLVLAFFVPDLLIYSRAQERQQNIQMALPDTLDQMTISVEAGLGFESAMAKAASVGVGPLAEEMVRTLQDMSIGRSRRDAYEALAARTNSVDLRRFSRAVMQADTYGIAIADVLRVQASEMRVKRRQRAEEQAMKVPVKVIFPLIFCILPVLFIVLLTPAVLSIMKTFS